MENHQSSAGGLDIL